MNYAGLIYDDSRHYLDHLAPFCALLNWPLILCEPLVADLARKYYPDLKIIESSVTTLTLPTNTLACDSEPLLRAAFPNQKTNLLWLPHGNSDKGWHGPFFEGVGQMALVYGQKMIDFMHKKNAYPKTLRIGNFRWDYFQKHKRFYEKTVSLPKVGKTILYAPTWDGSFWDAIEGLSKSGSTLFVKLHPNTLRKYEVELIRYKAPKQIHFLPEIPPIYPILSQCDGYIGDMSSVGYDFLKFDKPLFFLNADPSLPLHACGEAIQPDTFTLDGEDCFSDIRKATYRYTFDDVPDWNQLKEEIHALCSL
jgi:hypothetical protein